MDFPDSYELRRQQSDASRGLWRVAMLFVGVAGAYLLATTVTSLGARPTLHFVPRAVANQLRLPPGTAPRRPFASRFRIDPDDIIDVSAEVVDAGDEKAKPKPAGRAPEKPQYYEESTYRQTTYRQVGDDIRGNPYEQMFNGQRGQGPIFDFQENGQELPWWVSLLPYLPYALLGVLGLLAVGCLVSGALGWIFSFLGCLVVANAIAGFFIGDDDVNDPFAGRRPPRGPRDPRDPWA